jgi:hypothetical protein
MVNVKNHFLIFGFDPSNNHLPIEQHIYFANHNPQSYDFPAIQSCSTWTCFDLLILNMKKMGFFLESCDMELFRPQIIQSLQPHYM